MPRKADDTALAPGALSPRTRRTIQALKETLLFGEEDEAILRRSGAILAGQEEAILDAWSRFVRERLSLRDAFPGEDPAALDARYRPAARQWLEETAAAQYDEGWLARQLAIGRRHRPPADAPLRHLLPLAAPLVLTLRPFLARSGIPAREVDRMQEAWLKAVLLQITLWSHPDLIGGES